MVFHDEMEQRAVAGERDLLDPLTRHDAAALRRLLHPDFTEVGRTGRVWHLEDTVAALSAEGDIELADSQTSEWRAVSLGERHVLVTYLLENHGEHTRRSSVWDFTSDEPRLLYHQGTLIVGVS